MKTDAAVIDRLKTDVSCGSSDKIMQKKNQWRIARAKSFDELQIREHNAFLEQVGRDTQDRLERESHERTRILIRNLEHECQLIQESAHRLTNEQIKRFLAAEKMM